LALVNPPAFWTEESWGPSFRLLRNMGRPAGGSASSGVSRPDAKECLERTDHDGAHVEVVVEGTLFGCPPERLWYFDGGFNATVCSLHGVCA